MAALGALLIATPALASDDPQDAAGQKATASKGDEKARPIVMQYFRPYDQRGINIFETTKQPGIEYSGFKLDIGAAFTSQFQDLSHRNTSLPNVVNGVNANQLADIGAGFNNETANLYLNAQLASGIRVSMTSYLSSRHHPETWVKDGYLQIDESPIDFAPLTALMQYVTLKVGHMEINYGDAHFRRTDNGNAAYNPFVGNYLMDAFTTEIAGEVYLKSRGVVAMGSITGTGGEVRGSVLNPEQRSPSYVGKLGFDRQLRNDLRVRLTTSVYRSTKSPSNTLYGGDRGGSRYYYVMENTSATESSQFTSGLLNPGLRNRVTAVQMNPFVKYRGLEAFGVIERASGGTTAEVTDRTWHQYAGDVIYRFLPREQMFVGARYNKVDGNLATIVNKVGASRYQLSAGWFVIPGLLMKTEYVKQTYTGFPALDIRNGGRFNGGMVEAVVAF
jgi:hypothetical protein